MQMPYREDLAHIHDTAFGALAEHAAVLVCERLAACGRLHGRVVDLGCGGGVLARRLVDTGYAVRGVDLSEALIARARARVPEGHFEVGSVLDVALETCVAVTAIGEVLGYAFDEANTPARRQALFTRVHAALEPRGVFVFDMAGPERAPAEGVQRVTTSGEGWSVHMEAEADPERRVLTRRITTRRRIDGQERTDHETHRLWLVEPAQVVDELGAAGFEVETVQAYAGLPLPPGLTGFIASRD